MNISRYATDKVGRIAFFVLGSAVLSASWIVQRTENRAAQEQLELIAEQAALRLGLFVRSHVAAAEMLANALEDGAVADQQEFEHYALHLRELFVGFQAVNWIDPSGVIQWGTPPGTNEAASQRNVFSGPVSGQAIGAARDAVAPRMSAPLTLFQGGRGVAVYCPVAPDGDAIEGYVNAVFSTEGLVDELFGHSMLRESYLRVTDEGGEIFSSANLEFGEFCQETAVMTKIPVLNRTWEFCLDHQSPALAGVGRVFDLALLMMGGGLALALSAALQLLFNAQSAARRAAEERAELQDQLVHSHKMEAVGRLAGGVAHDFNNLLTTILGNADLIKSGAALDEAAETSLDQIQIAGERAAQLTGRLLALSRKQVVQPRRIDLNQELRTLDGVLRRLIREEIEFVVQVDRQPAVIELDPTQLSQVIINLVVNAVNAMPKRGELGVRSESLHVGREGVPGDWVVLRVEDTGTGMDAETRRRATEPFFTTRAEGTGLGLATVADIASRAGGSVQIESRAPRGTRISVWFPASKETLEEVSPGPAALSSGGGRALIVEDESAVRSLGARILRDDGYEVVEACDGEEALELLEHEVPFDLIFTDAVMPKLGGWSMIVKLRERGVKCALVITSGYADELQAADIERLSAEFLPKPYTIQSLRAAIHGAADAMEREAHV